MKQIAISLYVFICSVMCGLMFMFWQENVWAGFFMFMLVILLTSLIVREL